MSAPVSDEASRSTLKLLILYVPQGSEVELDPDLLAAAEKLGVTIKIQGIQWNPGLDPNFKRKPPSDSRISKQKARDGFLRAGFCNFRDDGVMPVICPTCQSVSERSTNCGKIDETVSTH